jgi:hypothetical protein
MAKSFLFSLCGPTRIWPNNHLSPHVLFSFFLILFAAGPVSLWPSAPRPFDVWPNSGPLLPKPSSTSSQSKPPPLDSNAVAAARRRSPPAPPWLQSNGFVTLPSPQSHCFLSPTHEDINRESLTTDSRSPFASHPPRSFSRHIKEHYTVPLLHRFQIRIYSFIFVPRAPPHRGQVVAATSLPPLAQTVPLHHHLTPRVRLPMTSSSSRSFLDEKPTPQSQPCASLR